MRKFFIITSSIITGLLVGIIGTTIYLNNQSSKVSNFTIRTTNLAAKPEMISYSSNNLPQINLSQDSAVQKFKSLYTHAVVKSITLSLSKDIYVYDIVGYDDRKDCTIQVDATNNKILGQSTQVLDYDYEKDASLNLKKTISRQEANEIALKEFSGGTPISWELTDDNNHSIWKVKMIHGEHKHTVKINARTKAVI